MKIIGIVDTMFARVNMGGIATDRLVKKPGYESDFKIERVTVPGFKDLALASKRLIKDKKADIVLAMGMPGGAELDKACAHEASMGIMLAQLMTDVPILEVFVHEIEGEGDEQALLGIFHGRCTGHADNAYDMLFNPQSLTDRAGTGVRQGSVNAGPLLSVVGG